MKKYRKKPIEVEVYEYLGDGLEALEWASEIAPNSPTKLVIRLSPFKSGLFIETLEGEMHVSEGSYIIKGIKDEFYACEKLIFEETYEEVK